MEPSQEIFDAVPHSNDGFSPLGLAAFFGHVETVKLLLTRGADSQGAAALAATKGRLEVLKLLKGQV